MARYSWGHGRLLLKLLCAVGVLLVALVLAAPAGAEAPKLDPSSPIKCGDGTVAQKCGAFESITPGYVAVDEETDEVYVSDRANDAVDVFSEAGVYLRQILGKSTTAGSFGFGEAEDIAVDNSGGTNKGRVYVESQGDGKVFAFDSSGKFLWESSAGIAAVEGVAVDGSGNPWLSDIFNGIQELGPVDGSAVGNPILTSQVPTELAFDSAGNFAAIIGGGGVHLFDQSGQELHKDDTGISNTDVAVETVTNSVYAVDANGVTIWDSSGKVVAGSQFGPHNIANGVAVDALDRKVYVTVPSEGKVEIYDIPVTYKLTVSTGGAGSGAVKCGGSTCNPGYSVAETVKLEALAATGSVFAGWKVTGTTSSCTTAAVCELALTADTTVEADFVPEEHELTVSTSGSGEVSSNPAGIACGATCKASFVADGLVVLTAAPAAHNHLVGWGGTGCEEVTAEKKCVVAMSKDQSVSAEFAATIRKLTVGTAGSGSGSVACQVGVGPQEPCASQYPDGTVITLVASPGSGSTFVGFSGGGCSGAGSCVVTLTGDTAVTATFNVIPPVEKPAEKPVEKPAERPVEKPAGKPVVKKSLTRGQLLAAAIKKCKKLPKHKQAACIKKAKKKYAPPRHKKKK